ncbi:MAG: matrixin family metalloprotease [Acidobacteriota bacterium]
MAGRFSVWFVLYFCSAVAAQELPPLRLKSGRVPPNLLASPEGKERAAAGWRGAWQGRAHWLVQFRAEPDEELIERLGWLDVRVLQYVPDQGLLVSAPAETDWAAAGAAYAGLLTAEEKWSPALPEEGEAAAVIELHLDVARSDGVVLAQAAGLELREHPELLPNAMLVRGSVEALRALAGLDEVAYVYPAGESLWNGEPLAACASGLMGPAALTGANLASTFGEGWDGPGLGAASLSVYIGALPAWLDRGSMLAEVRRALGAWASAAQLSFSEADVRRLRRQIEIWAAAGDHGDGFPFDGRGGVLAHTFYPPPNAETIAGDMHLDLDEPWKTGADIDLFSVVLHELGHALGLGHNDDPGSVMYPYYRRLAGLTAADKAEIRRLYAAREEAPPAPPTPPSAPPANPTPPSNPAPPSDPPPGDPPSTPDTVAPSLTITFPYSPVSGTSSGTITIRGTARDNVAVREITWSAKSGSGTAQGPPDSFTAGPIPLARGFNPITITAVDAAGNITRRNLGVTRW